MLLCFLTSKTNGGFSHLENCENILGSKKLSFILELSLYKALHPKGSNPLKMLRNGTILKLPNYFRSYLGEGEVRDDKGNVAFGKAALTFHGNLDDLMKGTHGNCFTFDAKIFTKNGIFDINPFSLSQNECNAMKLRALDYYPLGSNPLSTVAPHRYRMFPFPLNKM